MQFKLSSLLEDIRAYRNIWVLILLAVAALAFPLVITILNAAPKKAITQFERIDSFTSQIELQPSGQAFVQEQFVYNAKVHPKKVFVRSLTRNHPFGDYFLYDRGIRFSQVTRNATPESFTTHQTNEYVSLRLERKAPSISGEQPYQISYVIHQAASQIGEIETVRLSPTDRTFGVPIDASSVTVMSPVAPLRARCYVGTVPGKEVYPCRTDSTGGTLTRFQAIRWLESEEGLFIELDYPRGTFASPLSVRPAPRIPAWILIIGVHLLFMTGLWFFLGRDDRGRGVVIPSEEVLNDIKPYEAGALLAQGPSYASFVGMILDLVERGAVKLNRQEGGGYLMFNIERVRGTHRLDAIEVPVLQRLFQYPFPSSEGSKDEMEYVRLGKHSEETRLAYRLFEKKVHERLVSRGWYSSNVSVIQLLSACILVGWTVGLYLVLEGRLNDPGLQLMQLQIFLLLPFVYFMPHLTKAGALAREQVKGLAWYIRVAEKDRLTFHENPQQLHLKPGTHLAYAVALGIYKDWERHFLAGYEKTESSKH